MSPCNPADIDSVILNSHYERYTEILNTCRIILDQKLYSSDAYDLNQWCLLIPMEEIFEDFITDAVRRTLGNFFDVKAQKSDLSLAIDAENRDVFNLQHDILLTSKDAPKKAVLIDTKYKLRDLNLQDDPSAA